MIGCDGEELLKNEISRKTPVRKNPIPKIV
jgi:hypothetical protein